MRKSGIILVLFGSACSGSLDVVVSGDAGPETSIVEASADAPVYSEPACTGTATTYVTVNTIGGGGAPVVMAGGWLYWGGTYLYGTPLGPTANPVVVFDHDDVYQSLASDGSTLFFSSPSGIGSLPVGATSGAKWSMDLGGANTVAADGQHLFWVDWAGTHVNSMDKSKVGTGTPQSLGVNVPSTDAGQLQLTALSLTSNSIIVSIDGGNVGDWPSGGVVSLDKSGNNTKTIGSVGATSVAADDTTVAWVNPIGWTVDLAPVGGGTVTKTTAPASYLSQNATAFYSSGPMGLYRINKSDSKVTQLSAQPAGRVAAGNQCLYFFYYGGGAVEIQIVAVAE